MADWGGEVDRAVANVAAGAMDGREESAKEGVARLHISLSAKRTSWRAKGNQRMSAAEAERRAQAEFEKVAPQVLERDKRTCRFCAFRAEKYQEVHHLNDDHCDNNPENLFTACPLCHKCFHIGFAGLKKGNAALIHMPYISQVDLNHMMRTAFIALKFGSDTDKVQAKKLMDYLFSKSEPFKKVWGFSSPVAMANIMLEADDEDYANRDTILMGVRLVMRPDTFDRQVDYWGPVTYKTMQPNTWEMVAQSVKR